MLRKEKKWNHIKFAVKITKGNETKEDNKREKKGNKKNCFTSVVDINTTVSIISFNICDLIALSKM